MSKKLEQLMGLTADIKPTKDESLIPSKPKTAPGQALHFSRQRDEALDQRDEAMERAQKAEAELEVLRQGSYLDIDQLHEVPGRRRKLSEQEYQDLKENLKNNELVQAITVRAREEGGYEIVSGNNRVAIYQELGREKILAVIQKMDDDQADLSGFYANLLQPTLPDFEKYLGFKRRQEATGKNQKQLAEEAGIPEQTVSIIFGFDKLPDAAKSILAEKPHILGASAASKIVAAMANGREARAVEAISKLAVEANFTQNQAVAYVSADDAAAKPISTKPVVIHQGKKKFCELRFRGSSLGIQFSDASEAEVWTKKIEAFIRAEKERETKA